MLPIALIERAEAAIAGIAHTQPPPANATDQQALQQTKALSGRSGEYFAVRSVGRQAVAIGEELIPADIARMVIGNDDAPLVLRHPARPGCGSRRSVQSACKLGVARTRTCRHKTDSPGYRAPANGSV